MQIIMRSSLLSPVSALLLGLTALRVPAAAQSRDGWTYTTNITIDSGKSDGRISMVMRYQIAATAARMDFLKMSGSAAGKAAEGMYQIFNQPDSTMTMVMPLQHMATVMGFNGMLGQNSNLAPKVAQHLTKNEFQDLGAGETILGHATHHVRVTTAGTVDVTMMGQTCTQRFDGVTETWLAPDVDLQSAMTAAAKSIGSVVGVGDIETQLGSADKNMPKGAALRTISRMVQADAGGKPITVTTTMELVDLTQGPLDASIFAVPAGFQTMDMREMMKQMPAGMIDSAMKAGVATGVKGLCPGR
jgi:hypothetical protein